MKIALIAAFVLSFGSTPPATPSTAESGSAMTDLPPVTVQVDEFSAVDSLLLDVQSGERSLTVETKRGPRTPVELRKADPLTPDFEIDIRIMDENGFPIFTQFGGHAPVDPKWSQTVEDPHTLHYLLPSEERATENFMIAAQALSQLEALDYSSERKPEIESLRRLAPTLLKLTKGVSVDEGSSRLKSSSMKHRIAIHDAEIWVQTQWARHGATLLMNFSNTGQVYFGWSACNHGACPAQMDEKCRWTSPHYDRPYLTIAPLCTTEYDPFSTLGGHNSNDDTEIQYDGVRGAYTPSSTAGKCSDLALNNSPNDCW